jgi:capsular polysaccharide biosynthesis protein
VELTLVLRALRRWWWVILLATVVAGGGVAAMTSSQPPMYTATAQGVVSVSNPASRPPYALASGAQYILDRMTSYAMLGVTTPVLTPVVDQLALQETPLSLSGRVDSHSVVGKAVLEVAVTYNDPRTAAAIADAVLAETGKSISGLEHGNVQVTPLGAAVPPTAPSNKTTTVNAGVAAVGGFILGCFVAVLLQFVSERRRRAQ